MKGKYIALLVAVFVVLLCPLMASADSLIALQLGVFSPGGDYPDTFDEGGDYGIVYTNISRRLGFEFGLHGYGIKKDVGADVGVIGAEFLVTFQDPLARIQPYAGFGFGFYSMSIYPATGAEDTGSGKGIVGEVGVRLFLEEVFVGLQLKAFSSQWDDDLPQRTIQDMGGASVDLILGVVF